jgi:hypothetical protein
MSVSLTTICSAPSILVDSQYTCIDLINFKITLYIDHKAKLIFYNWASNVDMNFLAAKEKKVHVILKKNS